MKQPTIRLIRRIAADFSFLCDKEKPIPVANPGEHRAYMNHYGAVSVLTPGGLLGVRPAEFEWTHGEPPDWGRQETATRKNGCCWTQPDGSACRTCGGPGYAVAEVPSHSTPGTTITG